MFQQSVSVCASVCHTLHTPPHPPPTLTHLLPALLPLGGTLMKPPEHTPQHQLQNKAARTGRVHHSDFMPPRLLAENLDSADVTSEIILGWDSWLLLSPTYAFTLTSPSGDEGLSLASPFHFFSFSFSRFLCHRSTQLHLSAHESLS